MVDFTYTIRDPLGIHARPAGMLVRLARAFDDTVITVEREDSSARGTQLMKLMGMGVKRGDQVRVSAEGASEAAAIDAMRKFFSENL